MYNVQELLQVYFLNQKNDLGADDFTPRKTKHKTHIETCTCPKHLKYVFVFMLEVDKTNCLKYGAVIISVDNIYL